MSVLVFNQLAKFENGASASASVPLEGHIPTVLVMSAGWTAAAICFQGSIDNTNFYFIYDTAGLLVAAAADANHRINLPSIYLKDNKYLKICSGTAALPVNQGDVRALYVECWE